MRVIKKHEEKKQGRCSEHVLVEDEEALENLELVLVVHGPADLVVQLGVCERHLRTQPLVRESRPNRGMSCEGTSQQHEN